LSGNSNRKAFATPGPGSTEHVTQNDTKRGQKTLLSGSNEVIRTKVGFLPPLSPPPMRIRKDRIPDRTFNYEKPPDPIPSDDIKKFF